jgi:hypothetical protein
VDDAGNAIAVWQNGTAQDLLAARYVKADSAWSDPVPIDNVNEYLSFPAQIATNGTSFLVTWSSYAAAETIYVNRFTDAWETATPLSQVPTGSEVGHFSTVGLDLHGNGMVVWDQGHFTTNYDLFFSRLTSTTGTWTWSDPVLIEHTDGLFGPPALAVSSDGTVQAVWEVYVDCEGACRRGMYSSSFE